MCFYFSVMAWWYSSAQYSAGSCPGPRVRSEPGVAGAGSSLDPPSQILFQIFWLKTSFFPTLDPTPAITDWIRIWTGAWSLSNWVYSVTSRDYRDNILVTRDTWHVMMTWLPRPPVTSWPASPRLRSSPDLSWVSQECPECRDTLPILPHSILDPSPPDTSLVSAQLTVSALHQVGGGKQSYERSECFNLRLFRLPRPVSPPPWLPLQCWPRVPAAAPGGWQCQWWPQGDAGAQGTLDRVPQEWDRDGDHQVWPVSEHHQCCPVSQQFSICQS